MLPRVGFGYDVHRFDMESKGDHLIKLCGVAVKHDYKIEAHSDGDVAIHALVDAILGALSEGDIGELFPTSDPQWQGADSRIFLDRAMEIVRKRCYFIGNLDVVIVCERPKVLPYRSEMIQRLSHIVSIDPGCVSVKAKTNERLGYLGTGEGIAAYVVVSCFPQ